MAFGQASGPPAGGRQVDELAGLLDRAGYSSFKEARHPFGLNQRQAGGKFTADEATELIERLQAAETVQQGDAAPSPTAPKADRGAVRSSAGPSSAAPRPPARRRTTLKDLDDALLVKELERRGWCCIPPIIEDVGAGSDVAAGTGDTDDTESGAGSTE